MDIQFNGLATTTHSCQGVEAPQKFNLSLASTISSQGASNTESKGFFGHIIAFFKWIFCCTTSEAPPPQVTIATLLEENKPEEAAKTWVATVEQDPIISKAPLKICLQLIEQMNTVQVGKIFYSFSRKYFVVAEDDFDWIDAHIIAILDFTLALPRALKAASNPQFSQIPDNEQFIQLIDDVRKFKERLLEESFDDDSTTWTTSTTHTTIIEKEKRATVSYSRIKTLSLHNLKKTLSMHN